jgi:lysine 2,3-aminomutase
VEKTPSWTTEFAAAFRTLPDLYRFLDWDPPAGALAVAQTYPLFVPRRLARMIKAEGPGGVLAREFLPDGAELALSEGLADPIGDQAFLRAPQLVHRYKTRALFTPTSVCPVHCRYCFRKNELAADHDLFQRDFDQTLAYLARHPEVTELIFTGGDPLTLSNDRLETYLSAFADLGTLRDVRFHTRYPVILPERLDAGFADLLREYRGRFRTLSLAIHVNHVRELDDEVRDRVRSLNGLPVQLLSQTVLLRGVNDSVTALRELIDELVSLRVRPYYLHHPDQVKGGLHFYLPLAEGRVLYQALRDELPGWALPQYVIDIPGGHGKVAAFNPETYAFEGRLISRTGAVVELREPELH